MSIKNIFFLIIVSTAIAIAISLSKTPPVVNDSEEYKNLANNLVLNNLHYSGDLKKATDYRLYSKRTPGYALFLTFQKSTITILLAQVISYLLIVFLGLKLLAHFNESRLGKKIYLVFVFLSPALLFHSQLILSDLLLSLILVIGCTIWLDNRIIYKNKLALLFVFWTIALLVKPVLLPSLLFLPVLVIYLFFKTRTFYSLVFLPIAAWIVVSFINYSNTSVFQYSSIGTINLAYYNAKLTIANKFGNDSAQNFTNSKIYATPNTPENYKDYSTNLNTVAKTAILENFDTYIKIQLFGMMKMILDPGRWELYTYFNENTADGSLTELLYARRWNDLNAKMQGNKTLFFVFVLLLIINLIKVTGIALSLLRPTKIWLFFCSLFAYFLLITGPIGAARFMLPVSILSIVLSVYGWLLLLNFLQKRSKR